MRIQPAIQPNIYERRRRMELIRLRDVAKDHCFFSGIEWHQDRIFIDIPVGHTDTSIREYARNWNELRAVLGY